MIGTDICIDPGSGNLYIWVKGKGVTVSEPNVVAYDLQNGRISALGLKAYDMLGKNHDWLDVIQPVRDGIIYDFQLMQTVIGYYIQQICKSKMLKPNVLINIPAQAPVADKRNLLDLATSAGAAKVCVCESPLAAAIGAGVDMNDYEGVMVVDIGAGTTDIAVIARGMICASKRLKIAGDSFDESIINYLKKEKETVIGKVTAEKIKKQIGHALPPETEFAIPAPGKNLISGAPATAEITARDISACIEPQLDEIVREIHLMIEDLPAELASDVFRNGIILTGGSALLRGIDAFFSNKLHVRSALADAPRSCTIRGLSKLVSLPEILERNCFIYKTRQELAYDE